MKAVQDSQKALNKTAYNPRLCHDTSSWRTWARAATPATTTRSKNSSAQLACRSTASVGVSSLVTSTP